MNARTKTKNELNIEQKLEAIRKRFIYLDDSDDINIAVKIENIYKPRPYPRAFFRLHSRAFHFQTFTSNMHLHTSSKNYQPLNFRDNYKCIL